MSVCQQLNTCICAYSLQWFYYAHFHWWWSISVGRNRGWFLVFRSVWGTGRACLRRLKKDFLQITLGFKWKRMRKHLSVGKLERRKRRFGRVVSWEHACNTFTAHESKWVIGHPRKLEINFVRDVEQYWYLGDCNVLCLILNVKERARRMLVLQYF